jgi:hypothetical protein
MSSKDFGLLLVAATIATASGCGVVRYRETMVTVRDEVSNDPVPQARVGVQMMGAVGQWNADRVPLMQSGSTDDRGGWKVTVPMSRCGCFFAECDGYESKLVNIQEDTLRDGKLEVLLRRVDKASSGKETEAGTNPPVE